MVVNDEESDRFPGAPHPRERAALVGHAAAEQALLDAYRSGRMHHAWILGGPEGIGKATLAYRFARFVLAHPDPAAAEARAARDLAVDPAHPVARKVAAGSHPDLITLRRERNPKHPYAMRTVIAVEQARALIERFATTTSAGGWRVGIVDPVDDFNASSANALLKLVEEPPPRSLMLLVAHRPARILPTIRSRCRLLALRPLAPEEVLAVMADIGMAAEAAAAGGATLAALAEGSVRQALVLADEDVAAVVARVTALLDRLPQADPAAILDLAESVAGSGADDGFAAVLDAVRAWLSARLRAEAGGGAARLAPYAELWNKIALAERQVEVFNLDRRPFVVELVADLRAVAARAG